MYSDDFDSIVCSLMIRSVMIRSLYDQSLKIQPADLKVGCLLSAIYGSEILC